MAHGFRYVPLSRKASSPYVTIPPHVNWSFSHIVPMTPSIPIGKPMQPLPAEESDELITAWKTAYLIVSDETAGVPSATVVRYRGTGYAVPYDTEGYARCPKTWEYPDNSSKYARGISAYPEEALRHDRPATGVAGQYCQCGFWAVKDPASAVTGFDLWRLQVELAGNVIVADNGYRAQWQRVMSVTAPSWCQQCAHAGMPGTPGRYLVTRAVHVSNADDHATPQIITVACAACAKDNWVPRGLSWLKGKLGTDVSGEFLTDDDPVASGSRSTETSLAEAALALRQMSSMLRQQGKPVGLAPGRTWRYFIMSQHLRDLADGESMVIDMAVTDGGLVMRLIAVAPGQDASASRIIWEENIPC